MLQTVIDYASFSSVRTGATVKPSARCVPVEVSHLLNLALFERPVQAELVALLLVRRASASSCVIVHGMAARARPSGGGVQRRRYEPTSATCTG